MQFFTLGSSKIEDFETCFYDIVITKNDHPRYVKHVFGRIYVFFHRIWVLGRWGSPKGLVHNLRMHFFTPGTSKSKDSEIYFF